MDKNNGGCGYRALSALPLLGHPRDSKRISMLKKMGFDVKAVSFERDYHKGRMPECEINILGKISHGKYFRRLVTMVFSLSKMRREIARSDIVYASGLDMAFMAMLAGLGLRVPVVVEIGDVREIQVNKGVAGKIFRFIESKLIRRCSLLVVTAEDFVKQYYQKWLRVSMPYIVIENKIEQGLYQPPLDKEQNGKLSDLDAEPIKIGYFGLLRCEWTLRMLLSLARKRHGEIEIVLAGLPFNSASLDELVKEPNIRYLGQYKSPNDLPALYSGIDLCWACYPPIQDDDWNLRWARPNRFYESCFYRVPLISRKGSNDSVVIRKYDIGRVIDSVTESEVLHEFSTITRVEIEKWKRNIEEMPESVYLYQTEENELEFLMQNIIVSRKGGVTNE